MSAIGTSSKINGPKSDVLSMRVIIEMLRSSAFLNRLNLQLFSAATCCEFDRRILIFWIEFASSFTSRLFWGELAKPFAPSWKWCIPSSCLGSIPAFKSFITKF